MTTIPWLGEVKFPTVPAKRAFDIVLGKMLQTSPQTATDREVPYLKSASVQWSGIVPDPEVRMWASPAEIRARSVEQGDLLVCEGGDVGRAALYSGPPGYIFQNSLHRVRPRAGSDIRFLQYVLTALYHSGWLDVLCNKATIRHLTSDKLGALEIPIPPLEEQRRIADFLDVETARISRLLRHREAQISALEERASALISEKLVPGILTSPLGNLPWPWLPALPPDRPLVRLGYIAALQTGLTVDNQRLLEGDADTYPYLRVANVQAGHLDLHEVTEIQVPRTLAQRCTLQPGDVLLTEGGDLDKLGRGTVWRDEIPGCLHQNHVFAIRPDTSRLLPEYLALMTQTVHGRCYFETTGHRTTNLASTNSSKIRSFPLPLPSTDQQAAIVSDLDRSLNQIRSAAHLARQQCNLLTERRQALITAAVTGQFDVSSASGRSADTA